MTGLFKFLAVLTDLVSFVWKRKAAKNDDPVNKAEKWRNEVQNEIATDNEDAANARVTDALARFRMRPNSGDKQRPPDSPAQS
jgi:hypothetical protein